MARRNFRRPLGERRYRKLFIIATEGAKTEPQYFAILNNERSTIHVRCLKSRNDNSPLKVLQRMAAHLRTTKLRKGDEAWIVVDRDHWAEDQLTELHDWSLQSSNRGFALSNPCFELWLLLHFEEGADVPNAKACLDRLKRHIENYDKNVNPKIITPDRISSAINRAKQRDSPPCEDWPRQTGCTTVYRLVENILRPN